MLAAYAAGEIAFDQLDASVQGWINHARYGDTWGLREALFAAHPIPRSGPDPPAGLSMTEPEAVFGEMPCEEMVFLGNLREVYP